MNPSTARGGASGWLSTASVSRWKTGTGPRGFTTCVTSTRRRTTTRRRTMASCPSSPTPIAKTAAIKVEREERRDKPALRTDPAASAAKATSGPDADNRLLDLVEKDLDKAVEQ